MIVPDFNVCCAEQVDSFVLGLGSAPQDVLMRGAARVKLNNAFEKGSHIALYDDEQKRPYLKYPDGRVVYELG